MFLHISVTTSSKIGLTDFWKSGVYALSHMTLNRANVALGSSGGQTGNHLAGQLN